jgi:Tfp pilus assembly protein PilP
MKTSNLLTLGLLSAAVSASAFQTGPKPAAPPPAAATPAPAAPAASPSPTPSVGGEIVQSILEQELEAPRNGYIYNPAGRRDPFISLAKPFEEPGVGGRPRRPGIEGFLLQETALKGVVKTVDGWIAVLEGPDKKGYFVRVGQRLHDGVITSIDTAGLTFRQEITDPLSPAKSRDVRRLLNSAQEESNK